MILPDARVEELAQQALVPKLGVSWEYAIAQAIKQAVREAAEECAKICEPMSIEMTAPNHFRLCFGEMCADAIRKAVTRVKGI